MEREEIPIMREVLMQAIRSEATAVATLWALARLSYVLRQKGLLTDGEVSEAFAPDQIEATIPESLRSEVVEAIEHLRKQSRGVWPTGH